LGGGTAFSEFGRAKTSKIWCNLGQLSSLTANISDADRDIDKRLTALSSSITPELNQKIDELWSTNKKVIVTHVDPKLTLCIPRMLMHLSLGHVTLLPWEFHPFKFSPNRSTGTGWTHIGLCPKFLVAYYF